MVAGSIFLLADSKQITKQLQHGLKRRRCAVFVNAGLINPDPVLSAMIDKFKSVPLPPGSFRSPDDWSPLAVLPGAPKESPELSITSSGVQYAGVTGQAAVRRTLAPRHYSAVKKYFENSK